MRVLGIAGSLRSARYGHRSDLCDEIAALESEEGLRRFIRDQTRIHLQSFLDAGRARGQPFDEIYRNLRKRCKDQGLSNSEASLTAALWGAHQNGCEIDYLCLATHMTPECTIKNETALRDKLLSADAIILSGPVYFGDRSSLSQTLFELIRLDPELRDSVRNVIFAGLAVGAKRNGGQETTLIYQMLDATNLGMLVVGNASETTAQYGGTSMAGDVGFYSEDEYGFKTSLSTGRRVADVLQLKLDKSAPKTLDDVQIGIWLLQDDMKGSCRRYAERFCREAEKEVQGIKLVIREVTKGFVYRCIACDICPIAVGPVEDYRCIVKTESDYFVQHHKSLIEDDAVLLMAYSPQRPETIISKYQQFIERTRYLRRDNYVFSNHLASAFVITELDANKNYHIRMLTSMIRHHTIVHKPIIGYEQNGELLNPDTVAQTLRQFAENAKAFTKARLGRFKYDSYNPLGYVISADLKKENEASGVLEKDERIREERHERKRSFRTKSS